MNSIKGLFLLVIFSQLIYAKNPPESDDDAENAVSPVVLANLELQLLDEDGGYAAEGFLEERRPEYREPNSNSGEESTEAGSGTEGGLTGTSGSTSGDNNLQIVDEDNDGQASEPELEGMSHRGREFVPVAQPLIVNGETNHSVIEPMKPQPVAGPSTSGSESHFRGVQGPSLLRHSTYGSRFYPAAGDKRKRRNTTSTEESELSEEDILESETTKDVDRENKSDGDREVNKRHRNEEDVNKNNYGKYDDDDDAKGEREFWEEMNMYSIDISTPIWHHYTYDTGAYNREELQIVEVVAEKTFFLDRQIVEWVSLRHRAVGRGEHGLSLVSAQPDRIYVENKEMIENISSVCMFEWWNEEEKSLLIGLLTSHLATIKWDQLNDHNTLKPMWSWYLNDPIVHLSIFKRDKEWKVAVTHETKENYKRVISVYGLELWKEWWFEERLKGCSKPVPFNNGRYLATILEDYSTVAVYKYDFDKRRYYEYKTFISQEVQHISAFAVGSSSFLAIGGENPVVYEVRGGDFVAKYVHDYKLNHVEAYLPIPLGYYRNDALVLIQHKLDHDSHSSHTLEAIQWDGDKFRLLDHSPCRSHEEEMYGFSCITDAEYEKGIVGASFLRTPDDQVHILTSSDEYVPMVFNVKTELVDLPNPIHDEVVEMARAKERVQETFLARKRVISEAERLLERMEKNRFFAADYSKVREIHAPSVHIEGDIRDSLSGDGYLNVAGQDWRDVDLHLDTAPLLERIKTNHERIKNTVNRLKSAVAQKEGSPSTLNDVTVTGEIVVQGKMKVKNAQIDNLNGVGVENILKMKTDKDNSKLIIEGHVTADGLDVDNVDVQFMNGMDLSDPTKVAKKKVVIEGDLEIRNHLHIRKDVELHNNGTINGIDFGKDVYVTGRDMECDSYLSFDNIIVKSELTADNSVNGYKFTEEGFKKLLEEKEHIDEQNLMGSDELTLNTLTVIGGMTFDNVNGKSWDEYMDRVVMTDKSDSLEEIKISGVVTVGRNLDVEILNGLSFPSDYLLVNESSSAVFTASKTFANVLQVDEVDCEETISGIAPEDIVTLSTRQNLNNFTFFNLTITERLNVQGDITGKELDAFLANPRLTDSREIRSNVIFGDLRINGTLRVSDKVNGTVWNDMFRGVVMKTDDAANIDSFKTFNGRVTVEGGLNIRSGFLNDRRVSDFLTTDTEQLITRETLDGEVAFLDLQVDGRFDDVDVSELMRSTVKLSGNQTILADMVFDQSSDIGDSEGEDGLPSLEASALQVLKSCNDWEVPGDAVFGDQEVINLNASHFSTLHADHLIVEGNLITEYPVCGIDLLEFDKFRLSKTRSKEIVAPYRIFDLTSKTLGFEELNGMNKYRISDFNRVMKNIKNELLYGNIGIDTLHLGGSLDAKSINGIDMYELSINAIDLNENNAVYNEITFMDNVDVQDLYVEGYAYGYNFVEKILDLVQTTDDPVVITGIKTYLSGLDLRGNITTNYINHYKVSNILSANGAQVINANLYIQGDLIVKNDIIVDGLIKGNDLKSLEKLFEHLDNTTILLKSDVTFKNDILIDDLVIHGLINDIHNLREIFLATPRKFGNANRFTKMVTFLKPVIIKNALDIGTYNGLDLNYILNDIVLLNDADITASVVLQKPLVVKGTLFIDGELTSNNIQDFSIQEWKENAVYLDKWQEVTGVKIFENLIIKGDVYVKSINNINYENFITLKTEQVIDDGLKIDKLFVKKSVYVNGLVNGIKVNEAFNNTLMIVGDQTIRTPVHFHSNIIVNGDTYLSRVNSKNFNRAVYLDFDQNLYGSYYFTGKVTFENSLYAAKGFENVDFSYVLQYGVFTDNKGDLTIKGNWNVFGNIIFDGGIIGAPRISGMTTGDIEKYLNDRNSYGRYNEEVLGWQYKNQCNRLNELGRVTANKLFLFDQIEEIQKLPSEDFLSVHHFQHSSSHFIMTAYKWDCTGHLWKWNELTKKYIKNNQIGLGCPIKWYNVKTSNAFYFLSVNEEGCECRMTGTSIWSFDSINLRLVNTLPPVDSVHVHPENAGDFYTVENGRIYLYHIQDEAHFKIIREEKYLNLYGEKRFITGMPIHADFVVTNGDIVLTYSDGRFSSIPNRDGTLTKLTEMINLKFGTRNKMLTIVAVEHEHITDGVNGEVIIYEDIVKGLIAQRIPVAKPSSLTSIHLDNFQSLLMFVEENEIIHVYTYHGYQGMKFLYSFRLTAEKMFSVNLPSHNHPGGIKCLVIVTDDGISVSQVFMYGSKDKFQNYSCDQ